MNQSIPALREFPQALATSLGNLLVRFQALETTLVFAVGRFVNPGIEGVPPPLTMAILQDLPFKSLVGAFAAIPASMSESEPPFPKFDASSQEGKEVSALFKAAAKLCNEVEQRRNQLVHSNWLQLAIGPDDGSVLRVKSSGTRHRANPVKGPIRETQASVLQAIEDVNQAMVAVFTASARLNALLS